MKSYTDVILDVRKKNYAKVLAKQSDHASRYLRITVTDFGSTMKLDQDIHAYIQYQKPDGKGVMNPCSIAEGKIIVEFSKQMLAASGKCYADIVLEKDTSVLSTLRFLLEIEPESLGQAQIESTDEYQVLQSKVQAASNSAEAAADSANTATQKATTAEISATNAATSAATATNMANAASTSATNAANSATSASTSASTATTKATEAIDYANKAQSWAAGGTETREGEDSDNAKYYYTQAKAISNSFSGALRPMGTVTFSNLPDLSTAVKGDMYNISDQFTTNENFKEGTGRVIPAGANVYKTADGYWDILAGTPVTGVKGNSETAYRTGNVNITKENLGLGNVENTSDNKKKVFTAEHAHYIHGISMVSVNGTFTTGWFLCHFVQISDATIISWVKSSCGDTITAGQILAVYCCNLGYKNIGSTSENIWAMRRYDDTSWIAVETSQADNSTGVQRLQFLILYAI